MLRKLIEDEGLAWVSMKNWHVSKAPEGVLERHRLTRQVAFEDKIYLLCLEDMLLKEGEAPPSLPLRCSSQPEAAAILFGAVELSWKGFRVRIEHNSYENSTSDPIYELSPDVSADVRVLECTHMVRLVGGGDQVPILDDGLVLVTGVERDSILQNVLGGEGSIGPMLRTICKDRSAPQE